MTVRPVVASPRMTIRDVAALMDRHQIGSVLIKQGPDLLGIVTESDFVRRAVLEGHDLQNTPVSKIMTKDLVTISPGMDLFDAASLMKDANIRHLPVLDGELLVGFITIKDLLKVQPHLFENLVEMIDVREAHRKPLGRRGYAYREMDED